MTDKTAREVAMGMAQLVADTFGGVENLRQASDQIARLDYEQGMQLMRSHMVSDTMLHGLWRCYVAGVLLSEGILIGALSEAPVASDN